MGRIIAIGAAIAAVLAAGLGHRRAAMAAEPANIVVQRHGNNVDVMVDGHLFTRYDTTTGPNKPYFYPVYAPGDKRVTRGWPIDTLPVDVTKDHPHHRGLWFDHGAVNGEDYWSEGPKTAKTVNRSISQIESGQRGHFRTTTDWIDQAGKTIATDTRDVSITTTQLGYVLDWSIAVKAGDQPVLFGDTKEGSLGIRLADSMRQQRGDGHIVMSTGLRDDTGKPQTTWGKRADWVDYVGSVDGATVGVAIYDHPTNPRHPTYWHVRDYGLFAANPFGIHDFENDKANPKKGDFTIPAGGTQTFRYRIYVHTGDTDAAKVADLWGSFSTGPGLQF